MQQIGGPHQLIEKSYPMQEPACVGNVPNHSIVVPLSFGITGLFCFHYFKLDATYLGWMQYFDCFHGTRFARILCVATIFVGQQVDIDQIAEASKYIR